jgi:membrane dipeptidase
MTVRTEASLEVEPGAAATAAELGISEEALALFRASEVIDLHVDSFIWTRVFGYDLSARHGSGLLGGRMYSQVDLPRLLAAGIGGAMWSITTNPLRGSRGRARTLARNVSHLCGLLDAHPQVRVVRNLAEYRAARASGRHAALIALQGGNALTGDAAPLADGTITRVTLVHLTNSSIGATSSPLRFGPDRGLGPDGPGLIERLNAQRVFVDLAHISRRGFFAALEVHDRSQPLLVTHTGLASVYPSWRNIDDEQLKAVADTGGVVGVIFHGEFLSGRLFSGGQLGALVDHLAHVVNVAGEDVAAIGSDWDGAIIPPRALRSCEMLPRLVQALLERGFAPSTIQKLLGANFLRALGALRG